MVKTIKQATRAHFEQIELSVEQLDKLNQQLTKEQKASASNNHINRPLRKTHYWAIAAVCLLSLLSVLWLKQPPEDIGAQIAREVVKNHLRLRPLEVTSKEFSAVSEYFTQLDFNLLPTALIDNERLHLLGGRYCSIKSEIAAQIRYQDNNGTAHTLYQAAYNQLHFGPLPSIEEGQLPKTYYDSGFKVSIWLEKGLVMTNVQPE